MPGPDEIMAVVPTWMLANLGEFAAWMIGDSQAAAGFAEFYNDSSRRLAVEKPVITVADVQAMSETMLRSCARIVGAAAAAALQ